MTGRERARRIIGLGQPQLPKRWDFPETTEDLNRATGAVWRPLLYTPRAVRAYWAVDADEAESAGVWRAADGPLIQDPFWLQAWATRHQGWLIVYRIVDLDDEQQRTAYIDSLTHPELDRESVERIARYWWRFVDLAEEPLPIETNTPEVRYLLQFTYPQLNASKFGLDSDVRKFFGPVFNPDYLSIELEVMRVIAEHLGGVS